MIAERMPRRRFVSPARIVAAVAAVLLGSCAPFGASNDAPGGDASGASPPPGGGDAGTLADASPDGPSEPRFTFHGDRTQSGIGSVTFAPPLGAKSGDLLWAMLHAGAGATTIDVPMGWTVASSDATCGRTTWAHHVLGANETSFVFGSSSATILTALVVAYSGVSEVLPAQYAASTDT